MESSLRITVFCSSSAFLRPEYYELAETVGRQIAELGHVLVYGGTTVGMMNSLANGARNGGGKVIGVINQEFVRRSIADSNADELVLVETLSERKEKLLKAGDVFVVLPGGLGSLDELFEVLSLGLLGLLPKKVVLLNWKGFYISLIDQLKLMIDERFVSVAMWECLVVVQDVQGLISELCPMNRQDSIAETSLKED